MCLAVPGKILSIQSSDTGLRMAQVSFGGVGKNVCLEWLPDVTVGDYVIVHVGFALSKIDEKDAEETLRLLRAMGDLDQELSGDFNSKRPGGGTS